jgi:positive regulator of sigma E activity
MKDHCEARVISVKGERAKVKVTTVPECGGCPSQSHCHSGNAEGRELTVINDMGAKTGDDIIFEIAPGKFILSAALIWLLPLFSMFLGYFVAERFAGGIWPVASAFGFLVVSFGLLKILDNVISGGRAFYPVISKIVHSADK